MTTRILPLAILLLVPCPLLAQSEQIPTQPQGQQQPSPELQAKQMELSRLSQEIAVIEEQAREDEKVQETMEHFRGVVAQEMIRESPELEPQIKRQTELVEELTSEITEEGEEAQREEKLAEFQSLRQQIEPVERRVQNAEAVQQARDEYYGTLIAAMRQINPRAEELIQQHQQLTSEIQQLQQRS